MVLIAYYLRRILVPGYSNDNDLNKIGLPAESRVEYPQGLPTS